MPDVTHVAVCVQYARNPTMSTKHAAKISREAMVIHKTKMNCSVAYGSVACQPIAQSDAWGRRLDLKLDEDIFHGQRNGVFIELGAFDGLTQSNTAFFERERGWTGLLIEPSPIAFPFCVRNRPGSRCINAACVADTKVTPYVYSDFSQHLISRVQVTNEFSTLTQVPTCTLASLCATYSLDRIDFLSLDTEGYELEVLRGLELTTYRPRVMLIEMSTDHFDETSAFLLAHGYMMHSNFSGYTVATNPAWDGTMNDFLWMDSELCD